MELKHPHSYNLPTMTIIVTKPETLTKPVRKSRKYGKHMNQVNNI
jgi:hypothetical protein